MSSEPILVVGAGPSGLVLALSLLKNGVPVRIIAKELTPRLGERGSAIMPRSLELHKLLGTYGDIASVARPIPSLKKYDPADGTKVLSTIEISKHVDPTPQIPISNPLALGQHYHERILREHLEKLGASVEFCSELRSFHESEDGKYVSAEIVHHVEGKEDVVEEVKTPWLIGVDGAHSIVRKTLALGFAGETHDVELALGDIVVKGDVRKFWESWGAPTSKVVYFRPSGQEDRIVQLIIGGPEVDVTKVVASREAMIEAFYAISGRRDIEFGEMIWSSKYRANIRMVEQLRVGRVFIGGDAAHCHSQAGGQGMNSSIQDSFNLGWKLALVYKGQATASLLDTYGAERLPVIAEMLGTTTKLFKQMMVKGTDQVRRGGDLNQLGVNCRWSPIVYEDDGVPTAKGLGYSKESETAARPGDRAPGAPGLADVTVTKGISEGEEKFTEIYETFSPARHTILVFSGLEPSRSTAAAEYETLSKVIAGLLDSIARTIHILPQGCPPSALGPNQPQVFDQTLVDTQGHAYNGYHITTNTGAIAIVRPDGVIGARVLGAAGVQAYFEGIFNHQE